MSPLAFAWRSASREPARVLLGLAGIAAIGSLLFNMLLLSRGLLVSFGDLLESVGFDVRVTATEALPMMGPPMQDAPSLVRTIRALPEVQQVVPVQVGQGVVPLAGGGRLVFSLIGSAEQHGAHRSWTIVRGDGRLETPPGSEPRILVNRLLSQDLSLAPGAKIRLSAQTPGTASALPPVEFRVAGLIDFAFQSQQERVAVVSLDAFHTARGGIGWGEADLLLVSSRPDTDPLATVAAIHRVLPDLHVFSNEQILTRFSSTDFSYFRQISFLLSTITLFFAFLLVVTLLTVTVNQRFAEVATLRAIGFSRRRVAAGLLAESALLVGGGAVLSVPIGMLLSRVLDAILRQMPWISERMHFFVLEPRTVVLHLGLLALAALAAAVYPVLVAVRLPIAATLRDEVIS